MPSNILVVADNSEKLEKLRTVLEFLGTRPVLTSTDPLSIEKALDQDQLIGLVMADSAEQQRDTLALINQKAPSLLLYILVEESQEDSIPKGATGLLKYPVTYRQLLSVIREAENQQKDNRTNTSSPSLTGSSPQLREIQSLIRHVSMTDANVLILGESGTGKEVVARTIHNLSLRNDKPFVAVNCGAIPPDLLESELFGHEKGAFTGAISTRKGRFELAEGGTLFLDEIGDMPYPMQVKLLRVIQEKTFERVGGAKSMKTDVRLVAATHQDLENKIGEGKFRMDLYYRLNVFPIELEPLRNRPDDISLLIKEFSTRMELDHNSPIVFEESAIKALQSHPLPGNVRELENLVERLAILYPGENISNGKLPARYQLNHPANNTPDVVVVDPDVSEKAYPPTEKAEVSDLKQYLADLEKSVIEQALTESNWVVAKAAKSLSLQRTTLVEKIKKLEIQQAVDL